MDPEQQTFLAGATLDPALYATSEPDQPALPQAEQKASSGFIVMVDGKPFDLGEYEESNAQIQLAKNAALEGMTQFQIGRKMLHKHHHHDDDEHKEHDHKEHDHDKKHKHHDDDHDDDDHDDDDDDDDKDNFMMHETFDIREPLEPEGGPVPWPLPEPLDRQEREEMCGAAERFQNGATIFFLVVMTGAMVSGYRWRKSLRQKFNIKGSNTKDCLAWTFCTPCAICQETRTLTKNNCSEGVWHGPTQYGVIHAPSQQLFQSAAKA
jgi:Cys-rich protein (TIGR01571 family)